jgi:hypothetical protein
MFMFEIYSLSCVPDNLSLKANIGIACNIFIDLQSNAEDQLHVCPFDENSRV